MPCTDGGPSYPTTRSLGANEHAMAELRGKLNTAEAIACSLVRHITFDKGVDMDKPVAVAEFLARQGCFDEESGINKHKFVIWWDAHIKKDKARRAYEFKQKVEKFARERRAAFEEQLQKDLDALRADPNFFLKKFLI